MQEQPASFYDDTKSPEPPSMARAPAPMITEPSTASDAQPGKAADRPRIGWCGLGAMGYGMATYLLKQGYVVKGFDVFHGSRVKFEAAGGVPTTSLAESARGCPFFVCMVATAEQAQVALFDLKDSIVSSLPKNATLLLCSTVPASYAISVQDQLNESRPDVHFVDCPVSGGAVHAANGTLSIMAGASDDAMSSAKFLLDELTEEGKLYLVPGGIGQGSNMKMAHQVLAAIHILATSEAMGLAARLGLDAKDVRMSIVGQGPGVSNAWSWMFENRSPRMLGQDYVPGVSALTIILKDVGIITTSARELSFPARLCTIAEQTYLMGVAHGYGAQDDAGMVRIYFPEPVTSVQESLPQEEKGKAIALVQEMLIGIHLCATIEAMTLAATLKLPMDQFFQLVNAAAGSSTMFTTWSRRLDMRSSKINNPSGTPLLGNVPKAEVESILKGVSAALVAGQVAKCPLPLAASSYDMLLGLTSRS